MILVDVNVLVEAYTSSAPHHADAAAWLNSAVAGGETVGVPDETFMGFLRLVTNHRVFPGHGPAEPALRFCDALLAARAVRRVTAGDQHWQIFTTLVRDQDLRARDIPDAHLAALALERGASLATFDHGFRRFPKLRTLVPQRP